MARQAGWLAMLFCSVLCAPNEQTPRRKMSTKQASENGIKKKGPPEMSLEKNLEISLKGHNGSRT